MHYETSKQDTPTDRCSCPKSEGVWGQGGWHFRFISEADLGPDQAYSYVGLPLTIERCPAYEAAKGRETADRKRTDQAERKGFGPRY